MFNPKLQDRFQKFFLTFMSCNVGYDICKNEIIGSRALNNVARYYRRKQFFLYAIKFISSFNEDLKNLVVTLGLQANVKISFYDHTM